jgi:hypothetical protein
MGCRWIGKIGVFCVPVEPGAMATVTKVKWDEVER